MLITYDKQTCNESYMQWAEMMFDSGFYVSYNQVMQELHVSRNWVHDFIQPSVHHVKYSVKAKVALGIEDSSIIYFHADELSDWVRNTAEYTRQTKVIDLADLAVPAAIEATQESLGKKIGLNGKRWCYGFVDPAILTALQINHLNVNDRNRSSYPAQTVDPFDWFLMPKLHPADASSTELTYRRAFRAGYIKVVLCGKTIFVPDPNESKQILYPMTVAI